MFSIYEKLVKDFNPKKGINLYKILSNGKTCGVFISNNFNTKDFMSFSIGLCIYKGQRNCRYWYNGKKARNLSITGNGSLEGLAFGIEAIKTLIKFLNIQYLNNPNVQYIDIQIDGADKRRFNAYKYLTKFGFYQSKNPYGQDIWKLVIKNEYK